MTYTITSDSYNVTLNNPTNLIHTISKNVENITFNDNTNVQLDMGKNEYSITLNGIETSNASTSMHTLNDTMDAQEIVTVAGLPDSYMNTDYYIKNLNFKRESGEVNRYTYSITLERIYDGFG